MFKRISDLLAPQWVTLPLCSGDHETVLQEVLAPLASNPHVRDNAVLAREMWKRELKESTCIGNGIAFPHARCDAVDQLVIAAGVHREGIGFTGGHQKIHLIFCIGTPLRLVTEYLAVVGALARLLKNEETRHKLLEAADSCAFVSAITDAEASR